MLQHSFGAAGRESGTRRWLIRFFFVFSRKLKPSS
jgi:hypothetical protein